LENDLKILMNKKIQVNTEQITQQINNIKVFGKITCCVFTYNRTKDTQSCQLLHPAEEGLASAIDSPKCRIPGFPRRPNLKFITPHSLLTTYHRIEYFNILLSFFE